nr:hypothetical protein [Tanacetum cinerariifolium]
EGDLTTLSQTLDGWKDSRVQPMKEHVANTPGITMSFVNAVSAERKNPKINFRSLFNDECVENSDFVLPVENVQRAQNRFANSLVRFSLEKEWPFNLCRITIGFARALIEVSADIELKKEVTMVVPVIDGEGYTKERMVVEYEWNLTRCVNCKVFGHAFKECPKRVVESITDKAEVQAAGFTTVPNRKKKSNKVESQPVDGIRHTKPKPNYYYRCVEKGEPSTAKVNMLSTDNKQTQIIKHVSPPKSNDVVVKNSFSALAEGDESE